MKTIIAGSRSLCDYALVVRSIQQSGFEITEVVSGGARGIDSLGEQWAHKRNIPVKVFKPDWKNLDRPDAVIRENRYGKYNAKAGIDRNRKMAEYADALIVIIQGNSPGSTAMLKIAKELDLQVFVMKVGMEYDYEKRKLSSR